jgi:hypothetical protein
MLMLTGKMSPRIEQNSNWRIETAAVGGFNGRYSNRCVQDGSA